MKNNEEEPMRYAKILCLMLMCWVRFIIPVHGLDAPNIMGGPELPPELKRLISDVLRPSFQSAGYFPGLLQRSQFIEKIIPGQHFRGEDVLLHIDKMLKGLNGPDRLENLKVLEAICTFYVGFFKEYIHRKSFGGLLTPKTESSERARALILQNVHAYYMFSEYAKKKVAKIEPITKSDIQGVGEVDSFLDRHPLRLRLTSLIVNIFMLNREEKGIALQEDMYRRRKKLYTLLEGFQDEFSEILTTFLQRGVVQAKAVLQGLPEFIILLQEHALNISKWNMLVRLGQEQTKKILLSTISILGVTAALAFTWRRLMPRTDVEKISGELVGMLPAIREIIAQSKKVSDKAPEQMESVTKAVTDLANIMAGKVKAAPGSTPENITKAFTEAAITQLALIVGTNKVLKTKAEQDSFVGYATDLIKAQTTQSILAKSVVQLNERKKNATEGTWSYILQEFRKQRVNTLWNLLQGFSSLKKLVGPVLEVLRDNNDQVAAYKKLDAIIKNLSPGELAQYEKELEAIKEQSNNTQDHAK